MKIKTKVCSTHFRKNEYSFGLECDLSFILKFITDKEDLVVRVYDSVSEGNYVSVEELNGKEFNQHEMDLEVGSKSSTCRYILNVVENLLDGNLNITEDDIESELEQKLLSTSIDFNNQLQGYGQSI